jgi:hypothetical protein
MNPRILSLAALLLGLIIGIFSTTMISSFLVPASHKAIVDSMQITTGTSELKSAYLSTGTTTWTLSLVENFLKNGTYTYSLWVYSYQGDPEVYVCIWGPGEDGKTFQVELCASWTRIYTVKIDTLVRDFQYNTVIEVVA